MLGKFIFNKIYVLRRFDVWSINNNVSTRISKLTYNHDPIWLLNCMGSRQWNTLCKVWSRDSQSDIQKKENMASHAECFVFVTKGKKWEGEKCYKVYIKVQKGNQVDNQNMVWCYSGLKNFVNVTKMLQFINPTFRYSCLVPSSGMI